MFSDFWHQLLADLTAPTIWLELIAVISGIGSVWLSKIEHIWVYPVGLVNTILYIYLSCKESLFGEASVNFYYTVVSVYGWILWARKNELREHVLRISWSSRLEWAQELAFFAFFYAVVFFSLTYLKKGFAPMAIPWADAFASATAYTGMWLMAKKKVESWYWWIATNLASVPLYFVKHYALTSVYYVILLVLAVSGLKEWTQRAKPLRYAA